MKKRLIYVALLIVLVLLHAAFAAREGTLQACIDNGKCLDGAGVLQVEPSIFMEGLAETVTVSVPVSTDPQERLKIYKRSGGYYTKDNRWGLTAFEGRKLSRLWLKPIAGQPVSFTINVADYGPGEYPVVAIVCTGRVGGRYVCPKKGGKYQYYYQKFTVKPRIGDMISSSLEIPADTLQSLGSVLPGVDIEIDVAQAVPEGKPVLAAEALDPASLPTEELGVPLGALGAGQEALTAVQIVAGQGVVLNEAKLTMTLTSEQLAGRNAEDIALVHLKKNGEVSVIPVGQTVDGESLSYALVDGQHVYTARVKSFSVFALVPTGGRCTDTDALEQEPLLVPGAAQLRGQDGTVQESNDECVDATHVLEFTCSGAVPNGDAVACPEGYGCLSGGCVQGPACDTDSGGALRWNTGQTGLECVCPGNKKLDATAGECEWDLSGGLLFSGHQPSRLMAHWTNDEDDNGVDVVRDLSGNGYHGTFIGNPNVIGVGQFRFMRGNEDNYIVTRDIADVGGIYTIVFDLVASSEGGIIVSKMDTLPDGSGDSLGWYIYQGGSVLDVVVRSPDPAGGRPLTSTLRFRGVPSRGNYVVVADLRNSQSFAKSKLYVGGVQIPLSSTETRIQPFNAFDTPYPFMIGKIWQPAEGKSVPGQFSGVLNEVRIYDGEGVGSDGVQYTALNQGSFIYPSYADGMFTNYLLADGMKADHITLSAWIRPSGVTKYQSILALQPRGRDWDGGVILGLNKDKLFFEKSAEETKFNVLKSSSSVAAGQWQHVAATYDGQKMVLYLNGQKVGEKNDATGVNWQDALAGYPNPAHMFIGAYRTNNHYGTSLNPFTLADDEPNAYFFDGSIRDVRIYNRALSEDEMILIAQP